MGKAYTYIRFSTAIQASGSSQQRQKELIAKYIAENKLELATDGEFQDLGISSFDGKNLKHGLGKFMDGVRSGHIASGSVLIVESTDRLSRQAPIDAIALLLEIVRSGIRLVTLSDSNTKEYDNDAGMIELIMLLGETQRAHQESKLKSNRLKMSWEFKRKNASNKILTSKCPKWLSVKVDKSGFDVIQEYADTVKMIYEYAAEGWGYGRLAKKLNSEKIKAFSNKETGWHVSTVKKILSTETVLGVYQPHITTRGTKGQRVRVPEGDSVLNYYPRIIDDDLFNRVKYRAKIIPTGLIGRQGKDLTNLFSGLLVCGFCSSRMTISNKGPSKKGGRYLVCSSAVRGKGCLYRAWKYKAVEDIILAYVRDIDYRTFLTGDAGLILENQLNADKLKTISFLDSKEKKLKKLLLAIDNYDDEIPPSIIKMISDTENIIDENTHKLKKIESEIRAGKLKISSTDEFVDNLITVLKQMDASTPDERYELRVRIHSEMAKSVESVSLFGRTRAELSGGEPTNMRSLIIHWKYGGSRTVLMLNDDKAKITDTAVNTTEMQMNP